MALALQACSDPFSSDERAARLELLTIAPVGSDARRAEALLKKRGFTCRWMTAERFKDVEGRHDFLYCSADRGFVPYRTWQLALVHDKNFAVTDAAFGIGLTGP